MAPDSRVDDYLANVPAEQRELLSALRRRVAELVPDAVETISYGMPAFKVDGRFFISYAAWKKHCSIYPIDDGMLTRHADAIRGYGHTKGGLHFTPQQPLPDALLQDLVRQRANEARARGKY